MSSLSSGAPKPAKTELMRESFAKLGMERQHFLDAIRQHEQQGKESYVELLPGPAHDSHRYPEGLRGILREIARYNKRNANHIIVEEYARRYGPNYCMPIFDRHPEDFLAKPTVTYELVVSHPPDVHRLLRDHPKKAPGYQLTFLGKGVLGQNDNEEWRRQRRHLASAFLPHYALVPNLPIAHAGATALVEKLEGQLNDVSAKPGEGAVAVSANVDMSEELLHTAWLMLGNALFGQDSEFIGSRSKEVRRAFFDTILTRPTDPAFFEAHSTIRGFSGDLLKAGAANPPSIPMRNASCPMAGGLLEHLNTVGAGVADPKMARRVALEATATFAFAGHDTTGNTMFWTLFEMARHPDIQRKVQREIDELLQRTNKTAEQLDYKELFQLSYLTKCINESLRLWPAIANGTFRQLEHDDVVMGPQGQQVKVPKGVIFQAPHWLVHRSRQLWGDDAEEFNPDRKWYDEYFLPFTLAPRDCLGKNFAQMEMRVILIALLARFTFQLSNPQAHMKANADVLSENPGVLRPRPGVALRISRRLPGMSKL
jgi:cytochrome P450